MRIFQSGTLALIAALFAMQTHASLGEDGKAMVSYDSCYRVHVVYAMTPSTGEVVPKIMTCLSRDNAEEFQNCFSRSVDDGFAVQQAVDACRAKYNVSLFENRI